MTCDLTCECLTGTPTPPRFFAASHDDPFWHRQAQLLEPVWRAGRYGPDLGITWNRGQLTGDPAWSELLPDFDEPISCDPEHPDDELRGLLGELMVRICGVCEDLRFNCFTTQQIGNGFLLSVLCETEVRV